MKSGKTLKAVMISHAHPDHFIGLDVITERFPEAQVVSTQNVVTDIKTDGPWTFSMLQGKLGPEGPTRLVVPKPLSEPVLVIEGGKLDVVEFGEGESKHIASVYIPSERALLSADLVYNKAHLYLQERHLESWLARLDELEAFAKDRVSTIYPGHGAGGDLTLIAQTRSYLHDFADAVKSGDAKTALYVLPRGDAVPKDATKRLFFADELTKGAIVWSKPHLLEACANSTYPRGQVPISSLLKKPVFRVPGSKFPVIAVL